MTSLIMWQPWQGKGFETLRLTETSDNIQADGVVLGVRDGKPFRMRYRVECDNHWITRTAEACLLEDGAIKVSIRQAAEGKWTDGQGNSLPDLDGCIDIDFAASPFTNTLPIRRLSLREGQSRDIAVVYFGLPDLKLSSVQQRYTCKRYHDSADGGLYLYEGLFRKFSADLPVDRHGIVNEYPGTWRRIDWPNITG